MLVLTCVSGAALSAQEPRFPDVDAPVDGVVLDEELSPIVGAAVRLVASSDPDLPFGRAIAQVLRKTPFPGTQSLADGSFVLPLTANQRQMIVVEHPRFRPDLNQFWLVVEQDGYLPWREPIEHGLANYLGSRVILRKRRDGDPFAQLPWPPADARMTYPWIELADESEEFEAARDGVSVAPTAKTPEFTRTRLRILDGTGRPVSKARVRFGNSCYRGSDRELPLRADQSGVVDVSTPQGQHRIAILADGFMPRFVDWSTDSELARTIVDIVLQRGDVVDVMAVDADGRPVPFVEVDVVSFHFQRADRPSLSLTTDSLGRVRTRVPDRTDYFVYSDRGSPSERVAFEQHPVVRVSKYRLVTVVMRADALPKSGLIRRVEPDGEVFQSFPAARRFDGGPNAGRFATRTFARSFESVWIGGRAKPPIVIRDGDLPPPAAEPILDLALLDRTIRKRADIEVRVTDGSVARGFRIVPTWQPDVRNPFEAIRFSKRGPAPDRAWEFHARDDHAYAVIASAKNGGSTTLELPKRVAGAAIPRLLVELGR